MLFIMFMFLVHFITLATTGLWIIPNYEILLLIGSSGAFYIGADQLTREIKEEIFDGYKTIEFKTIERKYDYIDKQDRLSSEYRKFVIVADGKDYVVTEAQYHEADLSDYVAVHMTPKRESTIKLEIKKNNL